MSFVSGQDWEPVILKKTNTTNKGNTNIKINNDFTMDDEIKPTVSLSNSLLIQKARMAKNESKRISTKIKY